MFSIRLKVIEFAATDLLKIGLADEMRYDSDG